MTAQTSSRWQRLAQRCLTFCLVSLLSLVSVLTVAVQPSHAQIPLDSHKAEGQTKQELTGRAKDAPLSDEERLERAYSIRQSTGMREEKRQTEAKFNPRQENESLLEKAKNALK